MSTARGVFQVDSEAEMRLLESILNRNRTKTGTIDWDVRTGRATTVVEFHGYRDAAKVLNAIAEWNAHFNVPHPYSPEASIRYKLEVGEAFADARTILRVGHDDCDSLAAYLAGWLRRHGEWAVVDVQANRSGGAHATVISRGRRLDPSAELGMPTG